MKKSERLVAIKILCQCGIQLFAPTGTIGRVAKCGYCGHQLNVPQPNIINLRFVDCLPSFSFERFRDYVEQLSALSRYNLDGQTLAELRRILMLIQSLVSHKNYQRQGNQVDAATSFGLASLASPESRGLGSKEFRETDASKFLNQLDDKSFLRPTEPHELEQVIRALIQWCSET